VREIRRPGFNPSLSQVVHGALQIDGVPQDDGGNQQIEAAGSIALILGVERAVVSSAAI
jgi:hypothetical protein